MWFQVRGLEVSELLWLNTVNHTWALTILSAHFLSHHTQALTIPSAKSLHHHTQALTMASSLIHHTRAHLTSRAYFHGSPTRAHTMHLGPQPHAGMSAQPYFLVHFLIWARPYILAYYIIWAHPKSLGVIQLHQAKITPAGREHQYKVTTWAPPGQWTNVHQSDVE